MKRYIFLLVLLLCLTGLYAQEVILKFSYPYTQIVKMESESYTLLFKESADMPPESMESEGVTLNPYPFQYQDGTDPGMALALKGHALDATTIKLIYLAAHDNVRIRGYNIFRDNQLIAFSETESYLDNNLTPMTLYSYAVQAVDKSQNLSEVSPTIWVTTLDQTTADQPPSIVSGPNTVYTTSVQAVVAFSTNKATVASIEYGLTHNYGNSISVDEYLTDHMVSITGLQPYTQYHYKVTVDDYSGNGPVESADNIFYTHSAEDNTLPGFISNPLAAYISSDRATITFQTDEDAMGFVEYGETDVSENRADEYDYATEHSITLHNLEPFTSYYFRVGIMDRSGNGPVYSELDIFITLSEADQTAPVITRGPAAPYVSNDRAVITWQTNEPANSVVLFGTRPGVYNRQVSSQVMTREHSVLLLNLRKHTSYYYVVYSTDPSGNTVTTLHSCCKPGWPGKWPGWVYRFKCGWNACKKCKFKTKWHADTRDPRIKHIKIRTAADSATINWDTNELADSLVAYGTESGIYTGQRYNSRLQNKHEIKLVNLLPDTKYYVQIISRDPSGNKAYSVEYKTRTKESGAVDELEIKNITLNQAWRHVVIQWQTNNKASTKVLYRKEGHSYWREAYGWPWHLRYRHIVRLFKRSLSSGKYYYKVYSRDEYNQELEVSLDANGEPLYFEID